MATSNSRPKRSARTSRTAAGSATGKRRFFDYPRTGKGPVRRWIPSWRVVVGSMLTGIALVCGIVIAAYVSIDIPEPDDIATAQATTVYYADGVTPMATFAVENRVIIDRDVIPEHVTDAVVAAEDRSFYDNPGVDIKGMSRALLGNLQGGRTTGGSTITQQYAERYYTGTTKDYVGKFKEALLAIKLDRSQDKRDILANYLNTIYFGRGAFGIETAAQKYFGIPAAELTLSQGALLAGLIPAPSAWDPQNDRAKSEERWNYVLDGMETTGTLEPADRAALVYPETIPYENTNRLVGPQGYLLDMVQRELASDASIDEDDLNTKGYKIVTTIDPVIQQMAVDAVAEMPTDAAPNLERAIVTIDPTTGGIVALYGGPDFTVKQFNAATQGQAQAGSTFKPFALAAAIESGVQLSDTYDGNSPKMFNDVEVENFSDQDFGQVNLERATANSVNTAYVELNSEIGPAATRAAAEKAGIPADATGLDDTLTNVLGSTAVHPIDMAGAYATFAAQGVRYDPHILGSVTDLKGELVYQPANAPEQRFAAPDVAEVVHAMTKVVEYGSGKKAAALDVPIAGKTGTSTGNKSAWFVGFTPEFSTAVALYQPSIDDGDPETPMTEEKISGFGGYEDITGGSAPLDLWTSYMGKVLEGRDVVEFPERTKKPARPAPTPTQAPSVEPTEEPTEEPTVEPTPETVAVPGGLAGRSEGEARSALTAAGLNASASQQYSDSVPAGVVISASPATGAAAPVGSTVALVVSSGPDPAKATPAPTPAPTEAPTQDPEPEEPPADEEEPPVDPIPPAQGQQGGAGQQQGTRRDG